MDAALFPDRPIKQPQRCSGLTAIEEAFRRGDGHWTRVRAGACFDKAEIQQASDRFIACRAANEPSQIVRCRAFEKEVAACRKVEADRLRTELTVPNVGAK